MAQRTMRVLLAAVFALSLVLSLSMSASSAGDEWPFLKPTITSKVDGDLIYYSVDLKNQSTKMLGYIDLEIKVPDGTTLVDSYSIYPTKFKGKYDGVSVGWAPTKMKAGASSGPYVIIVKAQADTKVTSFDSWGWVRFQAMERGGITGTWVSDIAAVAR